MSGYLNKKDKKNAYKSSPSGLLFYEYNKTRKENKKMAKETYDFDFVYTADDGRQILIPNQSVPDEKKQSELLKAYAKEIADATGNNT